MLTPPKPALLSDRWLTVFAVSLTALGLVYAVRGYVALFQFDLFISDMGHRLEGLNQIRAGRSLFDAPRHVAPEPPWGWLGNWLVYWPAPSWVRWYYAGLIAAAVTVMAAWAYGVAARASRPGARVLAAGVVAASSICTSIGLGQNAPFVVLALVGALWFAERGHRVLAGVCLGAAMVKPQLAAPFVLPFLCQGALGVLLVAAAYMAAATLWLSIWTSTTPVNLVLDWWTYVSGLRQWGGYGPYQAATAVGVDQSTALAVSAVVIGALGLLAIYRYRRRSLLVLFALAAVTARLWSYHQLYDNLIVVFLMIALGAAALRDHDRTAAVAFAAVGLTLWIPGRWCDLVTVQWIQMTTWVVAAGVASRSSRLPAETVRA